MNCNRTEEARLKITQVQNLLLKEKVDCIHLKNVDWFAWATCGGDSSVIFSNETGVAEVLITRKDAFILTNAIEKTRMLNEQLPEGAFELVSFPWAETSAIESFVKKHGQKILCDQTVTRDLKTLKWTLNDSEIERYRVLGKDAAEAATETLAMVTPDTTEIELAGLAASRLWKRGIHPLLTLVGGERRSIAYRHPVATSEKIREHAMLVICGRRHGLFANFTRHVFFRDPSNSELKSNDDLIAIEAEVFASTEALETLPQNYQRLKTAYERLGYPNEINLHHQGGTTGYLSRERVASPDLVPSKDPAPAGSRAFAWNPSLSGGAKIEDTVLLNEQNKIEILTVDPKWPARKYFNRARPDFLIR